MLSLYAVATVLIVWSGRKHVACSRRAQILAVLIAGSMYAGQTIENSRLTYPLNPWTMYSNAIPPRSYYEFMVGTAKGNEHELSVGANFLSAPGPLHGYSTISSIQVRLIQLITSCGCHSGDEVVDASIGVLIDAHRVRQHENVRYVTIHEVEAGFGTRHRRVLRYAWTSDRRR